LIKANALPLSQTANQLGTEVLQWYPRKRNKLYKRYKIQRLCILHIAISRELKYCCIC